MHYVLITAELTPMFIYIIILRIYVYAPICVYVLSYVCICMSSSAEVWLPLYLLKILHVSIHLFYILHYFILVYADSMWHCMWSAFGLHSNGELWHKQRFYCVSNFLRVSRTWVRLKRTSIIFSAFASTIY